MKTCLLLHVGLAKSTKEVIKRNVNTRYVIRMYMYAYSIYYYLFIHVCKSECKGKLTVMLPIKQPLIPPKNPDIELKPTCTL